MFDFSSFLNDLVRWILKKRSFSLGFFTFTSTKPKVSSENRLQDDKCYKNGQFCSRCSCHPQATVHRLPPPPEGIGSTWALVPVTTWPGWAHKPPDPQRNTQHIIKHPQQSTTPLVFPEPPLKDISPTLSVSKPSSPPSWQNQVFQIEILSSLCF